MNAMSVFLGVIAIPAGYIIFLIARRIYRGRFYWDVYELYADGVERSISYGPMTYRAAKRYKYYYTSTTGRQDVYFMRRLSLISSAIEIAPVVPVPIAVTKSGH